MSDQFFKTAAVVLAWLESLLRSAEAIGSAQLTSATQP